MITMSTTTVLPSYFRAALRAPTCILRGAIGAALVAAVSCSTPSLASQSPQTSSVKTSDSGGFVFDASSIRHSAIPALYIRVGEKISGKALKRRFASYNIRYAKGEGCLICAVITGSDGQFDIDFDQDGQTVLQLRTTDNRIRDTLGNQIGSPLKSAISAETATCDAGESTTCVSTGIRGLSYIVAEDGKCPITIREGRPTKIPTCARIGGFQLIQVDSATKAAGTYNYTCKDEDRAWPLKVDTAKNILEWRHTVYRITETENCAKHGWHAERDGITFDFCSATQGYADFRKDGRMVQCNLNK